MTSLTIKLPPQLRARLEARARLTGRSVSAVVRQSLEADRALAAEQGAPSLHELAGDLCGSFHSGRRDLATHPRHLRNFGKWRK